VDALGRRSSLEVRGLHRAGEGRGEGDREARARGAEGRRVKTERRRIWYVVEPSGLVGTVYRYGEPALRQAWCDTRREANRRACALAEREEELSSPGAIDRWEHSNMSLAEAKRRGYRVRSRTTVVVYVDEAPVLRGRP